MKELNNKSVSYYATHPGELLKDELKCRKISEKDFAQQIDIDYSELKKILNEQSPITAKIAVLIESALNIDAVFWVNMQSSYDLNIAIKDKSLKDKVKKIRKKINSV
jgi:addiction module HigA family antidote